MVTFFKDLIEFVKKVAHDPRIPDRDKKVILALLALIISPIDFIPDWIPLIGWIDDMVMLALVLDYFCDVLDQDILLSHWPWDMKRYIQIRRAARLFTAITPPFIKRWLWKFEGSPYQ